MKDEIIKLIISVNDPPVVNMSSTSTLTYTESTSAVIVDAAMVVMDPDSGTLKNATVSISSNFVPSEDSLVYTTTAGVCNGWPTKVVHDDTVKVNITVPNGGKTIEQMIKQELGNDEKGNVDQIEG